MPPTKIRSFGRDTTGGEVKSQPSKKQIKWRDRARPAGATIPDEKLLFLVLTVSTVLLYDDPPSGTLSTPTIPVLGPFGHLFEKSKTRRISKRLQILQLQQSLHSATLSPCAPHHAPARG